MAGARVFVSDSNRDPELLFPIFRGWRYSSMAQKSPLLDSWLVEAGDSGGNVNKTLLLMSLLLVTACAGQPSMTSAERLELYRAHAGEPVSNFVFTGRLWGWRSLGDSALAVWPRSNQGYLIELTGRCPDMAFAHSIGLTSSVGRVSAGFDRVIVRLPSNRNPSRVGCTIRTIRPINAQVVKESQGDLGEGEVTERDPSIPDEPQQ